MPEESDRDFTRHIPALLRSFSKHHPTLLILVGLAIVLSRFFRLDGKTPVPSEPASAWSVAFGLAMTLIGLILAILERRKQQPVQPAQSTIVFYAPTIRANTFFAELLESAARKVPRNIRVVLETGDEHQYHSATNYVQVIQDWAKRGSATNTVIVMVPPTPDAYTHIWKLPSNLDTNLITLDMEIPAGQEGDFHSCSFHKKVILTDNQLGAQKAAEQIVSYCKEQNIDEANLIVCEGNLHNRGRMFVSEIEKLAVPNRLRLTRLGAEASLDFSNAVKLARDYVKKTVSSSTADLAKRVTFLFGANDNLAIGARLALSRLSDSTPGVEKTRIVCFDASTFVKIHLDLGDKFFWRAIDQRLPEMVAQTIESAVALLEGTGPREKKEVVRIQPVVYQG